MALTFAAVPFTSEAQPAKIPRIGIVVNGSRTALSAQDDAFRRSLRDLGWIDGKNITIEYRWAEGNPERLPALVAELVQLNVDVLVVSGTPAIRAAQKKQSYVERVRSYRSGRRVMFGRIPPPFRLATAWSARAPGLPLTTPYDALILASIVEKETGRVADRPLIAAVFINRMRQGMRLQTDPTVIYGLGERFDGNLHRRDLDADQPFNTYTRDGLPPTPIAMPSQASLDAVLHPPFTPYLYFVSRGDGSSEFSANIDDHNRAVAKYQKGAR